MKTGVRTAGVIGAQGANSSHGSARNLLLSLVFLTTAACADRAPQAARAITGPQPDLAELDATLRTTLRAAAPDLSQATASPLPAGLAAGADETVRHPVADYNGDKARVVFLHGLHSPFGMALAMSRMATP